MRFILALLLLMFAPIGAALFDTNTADAAPYFGSGPGPRLSVDNHNVMPGDVVTIKSSCPSAPAGTQLYVFVVWPGDQLEIQGPFPCTPLQCLTFHVPTNIVGGPYQCSVSAAAIGYGKTQDTITVN